MTTTTTDRIVSYTVRRPGCTCWSEGHQSERAAVRSAERAYRVTGMSHTIYAEHADGRTTEIAIADDRDE